ncbi:MAG: thymidylate synthase [Actinobacteria bacterium RBG_16_68_21]|nr:MAG: thymidylate synthase [Actinobacteria bacterium RBG_16_68_21]
MDSPSAYFTEPFTSDETEILRRFFTNTTEPVFALINLPEVVKGALFARYSRSPKSVRRLFLDEFYEAPDVGVSLIAAGLSDDSAGVRLRRAEELYERVFTQYGDDSVAQLGGIHLACEQASNVLTKVLEWGRVASYLEQSTRYMLYDRPLGGRYRYALPAEIGGTPLAADYAATMDTLFGTYAALTGRLTAYYGDLYPRSSEDSDFVYRSTIRARVCDDLRGLLPAATLSNVGIYASGQAYEMLLLRMRGHRLTEVRRYADLMLVELEKVAPAFLRRVTVPDRGGAWTSYLAATAAAMEERAAAESTPVPDRPEVTLVEWDPEAEAKVAAAALYRYTDLPDDVLLDWARRAGDAQIDEVMRTYVGERGNRRHKPGRALERAGYRFDILCDYGIFRDLQRHRMLTIEWQRLGTSHGYLTPTAITDISAGPDWDDAMAGAAALYERVAAAVGREVAQYVVPLAFRVRFFMQLNAREAFHLLELRTGEGGHPGYRRVCQEMHRQIRDVAGHRRIADAMRFVDHEDYGLGRLGTERRAAARRATAGVTEPEEIV